MPSTAEIASGTDAETFSAPDWTFSPAPPSRPATTSSSELAQLLDRCRQVLEEVAHAADERHEEEEGEDQVTATAAPSTVTVAASPRDIPVFAITKPNRVLEDERQEDADEDDQEGVADRDERGHQADGRSDDQDGADRQQQLDAPCLARFHRTNLPPRAVDDSPEH